MPTEAEVLGQLLFGKWVLLKEKSRVKKTIDGQNAIDEVDVEVKVAPTLPADVAAGMCIAAMMGKIDEYIETHPKDCPCDVPDFYRRIHNAIIDLEHEFVIKHGGTPHEGHVKL